MKFYFDLKKSVNTLLCKLRHVDNIPHTNRAIKPICSGFGESIYFSVTFDDKYKFSVVNKAPSCDFSCPSPSPSGRRAPAPPAGSGAGSSNETVNQALAGSGESSPKSNRSQVMSNVYTEDCKFIPRGFTHPDCIRLCMNESGSNGCGYNQCDASCQLCENQNRCRWLLDEELFRKNNQACQFNATTAPFRLGETERECVEACRANRNDFGGSSCTTNFCRESCANCDDDIKCPWVVTPTISPESITAPSQPIITGIPGNKMITVSWKRPFSGNSEITKYVIMAFETNNHESGLRAEVVTFAEESAPDTYRYTIRGLPNGKFFSVSVAALNAKGMSRMSNTITLKPYKVTLPDEVTEQMRIAERSKMVIENNNLKQDIINQMIKNKEKITDAMVENIERRAEKEAISKSLGENPVHDALSFLQDQDFNIEISS